MKTTITITLNIAATSQKITKQLPPLQVNKPYIIGLTVSIYVLCVTRAVFTTETKEFKR
jgi:hypothetical protein